jgi:hypothetical protein
MRLTGEESDEDILRIKRSVMNLVEEDDNEPKEDYEQLEFDFDEDLVSPI